MMEDKAALAAAREQAHRRALLDSGLEPYDMLRSFPAYTPTFHLARFLAHHTLFREITDLPGAIVELGVLGGGSLLTWARLCEIFCPADFHRIVYGFDTFRGFPRITPRDGDPAPESGRVPGGYSGSRTEETLRRMLAGLEAERLEQQPRVVLLPGDILETVPRFAAAQPALRIALLHLDADLYEPTMCALEHLLERVIPGGIVILDEWNDSDYPGETVALEEYYVARRRPLPRLQHIPWYHSGMAYFRIG